MVLNREVLLGECSFGSLDIPLKEHHSSRYPFKDVYSTFPSSQIHLPHLGSLNTPFCTWWHRLWDDLLAVPGLSLYRHTNPPVGILLKYIPFGTHTQLKNDLYKGENDEQIGDGVITQMMSTECEW